MIAFPLALQCAGTGDRVRLRRRVTVALMTGIRLCGYATIRIKRHIKIKATANPYLPEYTRYFWEIRHKKGRKTLAAFTARGYRAMVVKQGKTVGSPNKGSLHDGKRTDGKLSRSARYHKLKTISEHL